MRATHLLEAAKPSIKTQFTEFLSNFKDVVEKL